MISARPLERPVPQMPSRGDTVERCRTGVRMRGRVFYADHLQVLVKWDGGTSSSVPVDAEELREIRVVEDVNRP